ncbi:hypothetical protein BGZ98_000351 [Dissophora globulifera]|nr:hypothetical protein BGZ98_000351 [Dissophora globulifera]
MHFKKTTLALIVALVLASSGPSMVQAQLCGGPFLPCTTTTTAAATQSSPPAATTTLTTVSTAAPTTITTTLSEGPKTTRITTSTSFSLTLTTTSTAPTSTPTEASGSGSTNLATAGIVVGSVVVAAAIGIWVFRKWKLSPSRDFQSKIRGDEYTDYPRTYESDTVHLRQLGDTPAEPAGAIKSPYTANTAFPSSLDDQYYDPNYAGGKDASGGYGQHQGGISSGAGGGYGANDYGHGGANYDQGYGDHGGYNDPHAGYGHGDYAQGQMGGGYGHGDYAASQVGGYAPSAAGGYNQGGYAHSNVGGGYQHGY